MEVSLIHLTFKHPFTALIAGPSGSGKTVLLRRIFENHKNTISGITSINILWAYGIWQNLYSQPIKGVKVNYIEGLPTKKDLDNIKPNIIVIDDLMNELGASKELSNMFTKGSHHNNYSVFFILQNIFHQAPQMRNISLNSHYIVLMKNSRDKSQILHLAKQVCPENPKYFVNVYNKATQKEYGYLIVDFKPDTPDELRWKTRITTEETPKSIKGGYAPIIYPQKCLRI